MKDNIPKRQTKRRVWYHITKENLGKEVLLTPFVPASFGEPLVPRICVAPTIGHCLGALRHDIKSYRYVYFTVGKAFFPKREYISVPEYLKTAQYTYLTRKGNKLVYDVCDKHITEEKWILEPTVFYRCNILSKEFSGRIDSKFPKFEIGSGDEASQEMFIKLVNKHFN